MARGDIHWFNRALLDMGKKLHDLSADTLKLGIITNGVTPDVNTADPRWGAGGSTNLSSSQVATGTGYAGPITLTGTSWAQQSNIPTLRAAVVTVPQDAAGFSNGYWGVIYNDTDPGKRAIAYVDLGGPVGIVNGPLTADWNGANNDVLTNSAS
jgi:hypothetical protein